MFLAKGINSDESLFLLMLSFIVQWAQGHAAPVLYAAWAEAGLLTEADLLNLRKLDSDLEGHPTPVWVT